MAGWALSTSIEFNPPPESSDTCQGVVTCLVTDLVHELAILSLFLALVVVLAAFTHLDEAESLVEEERRRTIAERDALEAFAEEVRTVTQPTAASSAEPSTTGTLLQQADQDSAVQTAYRDTVMAVPHYDEEYGEPLRVNMAAELGTEVTIAVLQNDQLDPLVRQALREKARQASDRRDEFLPKIDAEATAVQTAETRYLDIVETLQGLDQRPLSERSFDELTTTWNRVRELERQCVDHLGERQRQITDDVMNGRLTREESAVFLQEYLYQPLPVRYPVLVEGLSLLETVRTARGHVASHLTTRA